MVISREVISKFKIRNVIHLFIMENLFFLLTQVTIFDRCKVNVSLALGSRSSSASTESAIEEEIILLLMVVVKSSAHHVTQIRVVVSSEKITVIKVKI